MRQQLGEGKEPKKHRKRAVSRLKTGSEKRESASILTDRAIDPAEFFDPEEFDVLRRYDDHLRP
jgi:hypothetical protein